MELKGIKKLNRAVTALVNEYICEDIKCKFSTVFCIADERLYYSLFQDEITDAIWRKWLAMEYGKRYDEKFSTFVLSFLHEVGHYFTIEDFDDTYEKDEKAKASLAIDYDVDTDQQIVEKNFTYWELPVEKAATDWAIDFYNNHVSEMRDFYTRLMSAITDFYNANEG